MIAVGCLMLAVFIIWPVITILVIGYAPGSWLTGFIYGFGSVEIMMWLGMRYAKPAADVAVKSPTAAAKEFGVAIIRGLGAGLALIFAGLTLLFLVFTIGLAWKGDFGPNLTGSSMLFGFWLALTQIIWNVTIKARAT